MEMHAANFTDLHFITKGNKRSTTQKCIETNYPKMKASEDPLLPVFEQMTQEEKHCKTNMMSFFSNKNLSCLKCANEGERDE